MFSTGGHYVAYAKHRGTDQWHEFNDSRVSRVSTNEVTDSEAYLLFYRYIAMYIHMCMYNPTLEYNFVNIMGQPKN